MKYSIFPLYFARNNLDRRVKSTLSMKSNDEKKYRKRLVAVLCVVAKFQL